MSRFLVQLPEAPSAPVTMTIQVERPGDVIRIEWDAQRVELEAGKLKAATFESVGAKWLAKSFVDESEPITTLDEDGGIDA